MTDRKKYKVYYFGQVVNVSASQGRDLEQILVDDWRMDAGFNVDLLGEKDKAQTLLRNGVITEYFAELVAPTRQRRKEVALHRLDPLLKHLPQLGPFIRETLVDARLVARKGSEAEDPEAYVVSYLHDFSPELGLDAGGAMGTWIGGNPRVVADEKAVPNPLADFFNTVHSFYGTLFDPTAGLCAPYPCPDGDFVPLVEEYALEYLKATKLSDLAIVGTSKRFLYEVIFNPWTEDDNAIYAPVGFLEHPVFTSFADAVECGLVFGMVPKNVQRRFLRGS
ncbi:hypothetical protein [Corynebacterium heidelbergense]|uniref:Uncharacterized protein n=1 Tax=Corynebacterium heidelbergense TaxID=2055947 RepID=A0A364V8X0_9CORY|nr:hypothetical protein [Corynebacterium heidelbergense]RAV33016.1 hypothetical protein DLJ54_00650 [Corynebacterium heidelbergense]